MALERRVMAEHAEQLDNSQPRRSAAAEAGAAAETSTGRSSLQRPTMLKLSNPIDSYEAAGYIMASPQEAAAQDAAAQKAAAQKAAAQEAAAQEAAAARRGQPSRTVGETSLQEQLIEAEQQAAVKIQSVQRGKAGRMNAAERRIASTREILLETFTACIDHVLAGAPASPEHAVAMAATPHAPSISTGLVGAKVRAALIAATQYRILQRPTAVDSLTKAKWSLFCFRCAAASWLHWSVARGWRRWRACFCKENYALGELWRVWAGWRRQASWAGSTMVAAGWREIQIKMLDSDTGREDQTLQSDIELIRANNGGVDGWDELISELTRETEVAKQIQLVHEVANDIRVGKDSVQWMDDGALDTTVEEHGSRMRPAAVVTRMGTNSQMAATGGEGKSVVARALVLAEEPKGTDVQTEDDAFFR